VAVAGEVIDPPPAILFTSVPTSEPNIWFDLDRLDADGPQGPSDGLRALRYEYCILIDSIRSAR
jgi:hypothetical protein